MHLCTKIVCVPAFSYDNSYGHSCGSIAVPKFSMHIAKERSYPYANERQLGGLIGSSWIEESCGCKHISLDLLAGDLAGRMSYSRNPKGTWVFFEHEQLPKTSVKSDRTPHQCQSRGPSKASLRAIAKLQSPRNATFKTWQRGTKALSHLVSRGTIEVVTYGNCSNL